MKIFSKDKAEKRGSKNQSRSRRPDRRSADDRQLDAQGRNEESHDSTGEGSGGLTAAAARVSLDTTLVTIKN